MRGQKSGPGDWGTVGIAGAAGVGALALALGSFKVGSVLLGLSAAPSGARASAPTPTPPRAVYITPTPFPEPDAASPKGVAPAHAELSPDALFARCSPSVVRVEVAVIPNQICGSGSGFFVSADGLLVTNFHVIRNVRYVTVEADDGRRMDVEGVVAADEQADLAVLQVRTGGATTAPLALAGGDDPPRVGTKVFALGCPRGLKNVLSEGLVSGANRADLLGAQIPALQTTAAISHGSSGGPLLTADGRVVGVTTASFRDAQNLNFAVPAATVRGLLKRRGPLRSVAVAGASRLVAPPPDAEAPVDALATIWRALNAGDLDIAAALVTQLRDRDEFRDNADFWYVAGLVYERRREDAGAEEAFGTAVRLKPGFAEAYLSFAWLQVRRGEEDGAIYQFEQVIRLTPADAGAYYGAGLCHARRKRLDRAAGFLYKAVWYDGQNPRYRRALAFTYRDMKQYADAAEQFRKLAELLPADAEPYLERGRCFVLLGRDDEAVELLRQAVAADATCGEAYFLMGLAHEHPRQPELALAALRKAVLCDTNGKLAQKARRVIDRLQGGQPRTPAILPPTSRPSRSPATPLG